MSEVTQVGKFACSPSSKNPSSKSSNMSTYVRVSAETRKVKGTISQVEMGERHREENIVQVKQLEKLKRRSSNTGRGRDKSLPFLNRRAPKLFYLCALYQ